MMWREPDSKSITNPSAKTSASSHFYYKPSQNSTNAARKKKSTYFLPCRVNSNHYVWHLPPDQIPFPPPDNYVQFLAIKVQKYSSSLCDKASFFKTFRARISKMSYRQFEALWYLRIKKEKKINFLKTNPTHSYFYVLLSFFLAGYIYSKQEKNRFLVKLHQLETLIFFFQKQKSCQKPKKNKSKLYHCYDCYKKFRESERLRWKICLCSGRAKNQNKLSSNCEFILNRNVEDLTPTTNCSATYCTNSELTLAELLFS